MSPASAVPQGKPDAFDELTTEERELLAHLARNGVAGGRVWRIVLIMISTASAIAVITSAAIGAWHLWMSPGAK